MFAVKVLRVTLNSVVSENPFPVPKIDLQNVRLIRTVMEISVNRHAKLTVNVPIRKLASEVNALILAY